MEIPKVTVAADPEDHEKFVVVGWEEFDEYARANLGRWNLITKMAKWYQLSELDRLKLLCVEMAEDREIAWKTAREYAERDGPLMKKLNG